MSHTLTLFVFYMSHFSCQGSHPCVTFVVTVGFVANPSPAMLMVFKSIQSVHVFGIHCTFSHGNGLVVNTLTGIGYCADLFLDE